MSSLYDFQFAQLIISYPYDPGHPESRVPNLQPSCSAAEPSAGAHFLKKAPAEHPHSKDALRRQVLYLKSDLE